MEPHGEAARYHSRVSEAADPSRLAPSGQSGKGETDEKAAGAKDGKAGKLPRPEGSTPCPRCDSMDTKFCYYNNYNVKQPRYFCKVSTFSRVEASRSFRALTLSYSLHGAGLGYCRDWALCCTLRSRFEGVGTGQPHKVCLAGTAFSSPAMS